MIKQIILRDVKLNADILDIIKSIDVFRGQEIRTKLTWIQHTLKNRKVVKQPNIVIFCDLQLTSRKGNKLKKTLKELFSCTAVDFVIQEKVF